MHMSEDFDMSYFDDDDFMPRMSPVLQVQGAARSQESRARLFLKTRLHMVMRLRNCSFVEAYRFVKQQSAISEGNDNG